MAREKIITLPIYGLFVVGLMWNFIVLNNNEYCISKSYNADDEEIFTIFKMLKTLKKMIQVELQPVEIR